MNNYSFLNFNALVKSPGLLIPLVLVPMIVGTIGCKPAKPHFSNDESEVVIEDSEPKHMLLGDQFYLEKGFVSQEDFNLYEECRRLLRVYDRTSDPRSGRCTNVYLAKSYQCTYKGIQEKFKSLGVQLDIVDYGDPVQTYFKGFLGFEIDQCGEVDDEPIVALLRFDRSDVATDSVEARFFCKTGSRACLSSELSQIK